MRPNFPQQIHVAVALIMQGDRAFHHGGAYGYIMDPKTRRKRQFLRADIAVAKAIVSAFRKERSEQRQAAAAKGE